MINQADIDNLRASLETGVQVAVAPQLFETPREIAERMIELADIQPTDDILEPSAGTGMLVGACGASWHPDGSITAIEINPKLCERLEYEFPLTQVLNLDFLECYPEDQEIWQDMNLNDLPLFDKILMNPPFVNGADIQHISHALTFLKSGGLLVGICAGGPRQAQNIEPIASFWEPLPAGTFKQAGTMVNSVLFTIEGE